MDVVNVIQTIMKVGKSNISIIWWFDLIYDDPYPIFEYDLRPANQNPPGMSHVPDTRHHRLHPIMPHRIHSPLFVPRRRFINIPTHTPNAAPTLLHPTVLPMFVLSPFHSPKQWHVYPIPPRWTKVARTSQAPNGNGKKSPLCFEQSQQLTLKTLLFPAGT